MFFGLPSKDGAGVRNRLFVDHVVEWGWGMGGGMENKVLSIATGGKGSGTPVGRGGEQWKVIFLHRRNLFQGL